LAVDRVLGLDRGASADRDDVALDHLGRLGRDRGARGRGRDQGGDERGEAAHEELTPVGHRWPPRGTSNGCGPQYTYTDKGPTVARWLRPRRDARYLPWRSLSPHRVAHT